jgi:AcrR family transcriptional regulator
VGPAASPAAQPAERSQQTLERLLDAAEVLIEEKGFDDVPVAEIARRARSSVGATYARFKDKDAILHAVHDRFCEEAYATADRALDPGRWEGAAIPEIVAEVVEFLVHSVREREGLMRTLAARLFDPQIRLRSERLGRCVNEGLASLLLAHRDQITHPDPALACDFACRQLHFTLDGLVARAAFDPGMLPMSDAEISSEITRSILAYLGVREPNHRR